MKRKKAIKQLRKKLKNKFVNPYNNNYETVGAIVHWVNQCGIECTPQHVSILIVMNKGRVFYPYQKKDRKKIIKHLRRYEHAS